MPRSAGLLRYVVLAVSGVSREWSVISQNRTSEAFGWTSIAAGVSLRVAGCCAIKGGRPTWRD